MINLLYQPSTIKTEQHKTGFPSWDRFFVLPIHRCRFYAGLSMGLVTTSFNLQTTKRSTTVAVSYQRLYQLPWNNTFPDSKLSINTFLTLSYIENDWFLTFKLFLPYGIFLLIVEIYWWKSLWIADIFFWLLDWSWNVEHWIMDVELEWTGGVAASDAAAQWLDEDQHHWRCPKMVWWFQRAAAAAATSSARC